MTSQQRDLRALRIEHDAINGLPIGSLTPEQTARMVELRRLLAGTDYEPWGVHQTREAFESIYGAGTWGDS